MAIINRNKLDQVNQRLFDTYMEFSKAVTPSVTPIVQNASTGGRKNFVHAFLGGFPKERVWKDGRLVKSVKNQEIHGNTERYELTLGVPVEDAMSDILAGHVAAMKNLGGKTSGRFLDRRVAEFLANGTSSDSEFENYDGNPLFSTSHATESGDSNSNYNSSRSLSYANLTTSWEQMRAMKDDLGNPLALTPKYIVVPAALELTLKDIIDYRATITRGEDVAAMLGLVPIVLPELDAYDTDAWFLIAEDLPAFVNHELEAPNVVMKTDPKDDNVLYDDELIFAWTARSRLKAGPYQLLQANNL